MTQKLNCAGGRGVNTIMHTGIKSCERTVRTAAEFTTPSYAELCDDIGDAVAFENAYHQEQGTFLLPGEVVVAVVNGQEYILDGIRLLEICRKLTAALTVKTLVISLETMPTDSLRTIFTQDDKALKNRVKNWAAVEAYFSAKFGDYYFAESQAAVRISATVMQQKMLRGGILDMNWAIDEIESSIGLLNDHYESSQAKFDSWNVDTSAAATVRSQPARLWLAAYREYEWIGRLAEYKITGKIPAEHPAWSAITADLKEKVWEHFSDDGRPNEKIRGLCFGCGADIKITDFDCGQIVPAERGGLNVLENLRPICRGCPADIGRRTKLNTHAMPAPVAGAFVEQSITCACGGKYIEIYKARHVNSARHKQFIESQKTAKPKEQAIKCPCGGQYSRYNIKQHAATIIHQQYLARQNQAHG